MELRDYWDILRRRWWLPLLLAAAVGLLSAIDLRPWQSPPPTYASSMRMLIGVLPIEGADADQYDPRYYAWLTSEYLVDDFTEVVRSTLFARAVSERLADEGIDVPPGAIQGSATTGEQHRIITLSMSWGSADELAAIMAAAADELRQNAAAYFSQLGTESASVALLDDPPAVVEVQPGLRRQLDLPLRILLAFAVGVGLVFLLDYLDTSVRNRREVEALGLPVIGEIPKR